MNNIEKNKLLEPYNVYKIKWTPIFILQAITLIVLRLPFIIILILLAFIYCHIPLKRSTFFENFLGRSISFFFGIIIKVENYKKEIKFPKVIVCNHVSIFDHFILPGVLPCKYGYAWGNLASKSFLLSSAAKKFGGVVLNKSNNTSKIQEIKEYLNSNNPNNEGRMFIFPEGRHTNGKYMINFKRGGFIHKTDVQPILITTDNMFLNEKDVYNGIPEYGMKHFHGGVDDKYLLMYLFRFLINPFVIVKVKFLPEFKKEEYCSNLKDTSDKVRNIMISYDKRIEKLDL